MSYPGAMSDGADLESYWKEIREPVDPKDRIISDYLRASAPKKRECTICHIEYVGTRIICGGPTCHVGLKIRVEENRRLRPRDYVSVGRNTFLVTDLPEDDA